MHDYTSLNFDPMPDLQGDFSDDGDEGGDDNDDNKDGGDDGGSEDDNDDDVAVDKGAAATKDDTDSFRDNQSLEDWRTLQREFLGVTLETYRYYSIVTDPADPESEVTFQLLQAHLGDIHVRIFEPKDASRKDLHQVGVQRVEVKRGVAQVGFEDVRDVFAVCDPSTLDVLEMTGEAMDFRSHIRVWEAAGSDIAGCVGLHSPQTLSYRGTLLQDDVPTLCLLDVLRENSYVLVAGLVIHKDATERLVDCRHLPTKKNRLASQTPPKTTAGRLKTI